MTDGRPFIPTTEALARGVCSWCGKKLKRPPSKRADREEHVPSCGCKEREYQKRTEKSAAGRGKDQDGRTRRVDHETGESPTD